MVQKESEWFNGSKHNIRWYIEVSNCNFVGGERTEYLGWRLANIVKYWTSD